MLAAVADEPARFDELANVAHGWEAATRSKYGDIIGPAFEGRINRKQDPSPWIAAEAESRLVASAPLMTSNPTPFMWAAASASCTCDGSMGYRP